VRIHKKKLREALVSKTAQKRRVVTALLRRLPK
jgi:hypothetical protein